MTQLSLWSADLTAPVGEDLGGLLAADGRLEEGDDGVRLIIPLADPWRASALVRECRVRDVDAHIETDEHVTELRTDPAPVLAELRERWVDGPDKVMPAGLELSAGLIRCWVIASGRPAPVGYLLGLDPRTPELHQPLAAVCAAMGLAGSILGPRGGGPAVRIVGHRRCSRLAEMVGTPPPEAPAGQFPQPMH
ncbi:hypothetical protein [Nakamurella multipartita]|uniref:Uncharacterized protein n=1 Tax=Nakamurella multipartita (strain ATCC 700099 / DSM 44233 / CIP 104796 / JCM 9543 / NBRC 105858 / Y-104) TaxID=479431 RepID=C8X983_NAKMY|nr:hypothetical protein [Nakamurella multipartita]ACV77151.1 hypothetical protein Namu_0737 [Nakamurella multipartita DSM 44233]